MSVKTIQLKQRKTEGYVQKLPSSEGVREETGTLCILDCTLGQIQRTAIAHQALS